jgi:hypothetical protein
VTTSTLAVWAGRKRRIPETDSTCKICGAIVEDDHHALITCTMARDLRDCMRYFWDLPDEDTFLRNGTEWLLSLLTNSHQDARANIIFLLWRVWHHRNNKVHGDGKASLFASIPYLTN